MWHDLRQALIITRREVRDQFRDWRIIAPILILTLFFPGLMNFTAQQVVGYVEQYDVPLIGNRLLPFLLMVVGFFPISVSLVIALESFVGEKERRSIEPLLNTPLTDLQLYLGKLFAVLIPPVVASYLGIGVYIIGVYRQVGWMPEPDLLVQILILTTVQALLMVCGAVVISVQSTSARAANLLASFIIVPMALLLVGESMVMFWANYGALWWVIFGQLLIAGLLIRTGIAYFNREELLGRELDTLNLRWSWNIFVTAFTAKASSVITWYHKIFKNVLPKILLPCLISFAAILIGGWIGAKQTETYVLPEGSINWDNLEQGFVKGIEGVGGSGTIRFFSVSGISTVWLHNIRTLSIAMISSLFTFGVLGILVLMLPFVIIGFFAATIANMGVSPWIFLVGFIIPHGLFEIPAMVIAGGAALRLGATLTAPAKGRTMSEALLESLADWGKVMIAVVLPLLLIAAAFEIYVTPKVALQLFGF